MENERCVGLAATFSKVTDIGIGSKPSGATLRKAMAR